MHAYVACSIFQLLSTRYSQCSSVDVSPGRVALGQLISAVLRYEAICHLQPLISRRPKLARPAYHLVFSTGFISRCEVHCQNLACAQQKETQLWLESTGMQLNHLEIFSDGSVQDCNLQQVSRITRSTAAAWNSLLSAFLHKFCSCFTNWFHSKQTWV